MSLVVDGDEEASWSSENEAKLLAGEAHGGCVHDGHVLFYVLAQQAVEQLLVTILEESTPGTS